MTDTAIRASDRPAPSPLRMPVAVILIVIASAQLLMVAAMLSHWIETDWVTTPVVASLYGVGLCGALAAMGLRRPTRHRRTFLVLTLLAQAASLAAVVAWTTDFGQALLLDRDHAGRIWTIIAGDLVVALWSAFAWADRREPIPGLALITGVTLVRAGIEAWLFLPLLLPPAPVDPLARQGMGFMFAIAVVVTVAVGLVLMPLWEIAIARWTSATGGSPD